MHLPECHFLTYCIISTKNLVSKSRRLKRKPATKYFVNGIRRLKYAKLNGKIRICPKIQKK